MRRHFNYRRWVLKKLHPHTVNVKKDLFIMNISGLLSVLLALLPPLLYQMFIDNVLIQKEFAWMGGLFIGLISIFIVRMLLGIMRTKSKNRVRRDVTWNIQNEILHKYVTKEKYLERNPGELKKVMENDTIYLAEFIEKQASDYYTGILSILLFSIMLFWVCWQIALFSLIFIPITYWGDYLLAKKENENGKKVRALESGRYQFVLDSLSNWKEIKTLVLGKSFIKQYVNWLHRWARFNMTDVNYAVLKGTVFPKIKELILGRILIYLVGGFFILKGELTIGGLLVFAQYYYNTLCAIDEFSKLELNKIAARWPTKVMAQFLFANNKKTVATKS